MSNIFVFIFIVTWLFSIELRPEEKELPKLKGIIKTIRSEFDVIDCINIYQQPAFDHPLLKDHKIQMRPSHMIKIQSNTSRTPLPHQKWRESGECPKGTIPIRRTTKVNLEHTMKIKRGGIHNNVSNEHPNGVIEWAKTNVEMGKYYGTQFTIDVWNPYVEYNEASLAQTWISAGSFDTLNSIEVGWMVSPKRYGDDRTHLFILWTPDGYVNGCYNLDCPGFIQISRKIIPGADIQPISINGTTRHDISIMIYKAGGNWWLHVNNEMVGYWPENIFPRLSSHANYVSWGGQILNKRNRGHHTETKMGSGVFVEKMYEKGVAMFHHVKINQNDKVPYFESKSFLHGITFTDKNCYGLKRGSDKESFGNHFFYGGQGYSPSCP